MTVKGNEIVNVLFWTVGERINRFILDNKRAEYGKQIVVTVSRQLTWSHILALLPLKSYDDALFECCIQLEQKN